MNNIVLKMQDVNKVYNGVKVLDNVSITIERGEIYGLVGNNGAGKTTLMRLIAGQSKMDSGKLELFQEIERTNIQKARHRVGTLIEDPGFYGNMTAQQNLEYFRIQFGVPGKNAVIKVLKEVGLDDCEKKRYKNFSLGMKQRLGIALALLQTPELLILDEPINGLDPAGIIEVRQTLINLSRKKIQRF